MKKVNRFSWPGFAVLAMLLVGWLFYGCGGGGGGGAPSEGTETASGSVPTDGSGTTSSDLVVSTDSADLIVPKGAQLLDSSNNPVTGDVKVNITYYKSVGDLSKAYPDAGSTVKTLYFGMDIVMTNGKTNVKWIKLKNMTLIVKVKHVNPGESINYYFWNGTQWHFEGTATVQQNKKIEIQLTHLSLYGAGESKTTGSGTGGTGGLGNEP